MTFGQAINQICLTNGELSVRQRHAAKLMFDLMQTEFEAWMKAHREIQYSLDMSRDLNQDHPESDNLTDGLKLALEIIDAATKDVQTTINPLRVENVKDPQ